MARIGNNYDKWLRGDNTVNIQGMIMVPLIAIFLYTKFDLNGNSSFKVICRTRKCDGRSGIIKMVKLPRSSLMGFEAHVITS